MKTPITLRSTLSNASWTQPGAVALLVAALMFALTLALQPNAHVPASAPAVRQAAPAARNPNVPINDTGSAYDGQSHQQAWVAAFHATHSSPIQSVASSAYDGQAYPMMDDRPIQLQRAASFWRCSPFCCPETQNNMTRMPVGKSKQNCAAPHLDITKRQKMQLPCASTD